MPELKQKVWKLEDKNSFLVEQLSFLHASLTIGDAAKANSICKGIVKKYHEEYPRGDIPPDLHWIQLFILLWTGVNLQVYWASGPLSLW